MHGIPIRVYLHGVLGTVQFDTELFFFYLPFERNQGQACDLTDIKFFLVEFLYTAFHAGDIEKLGYQTGKAVYLLGNNS